MSRHDLAVVGLGAVGGAAVLAAARAGLDVVGLDRFSPPHVMGSTHGETRIVRAAIGEGTAYSPLALRSFELNEQLADETGTKLLNRCGALILGGVVPHATHVGEGFLETTVEAARCYGIAHELLSGAEVRARFPAFERFDGDMAYFEPGAGMAFPERIVGAQLDRARALGADVRVGVTVRGLSQSGSTVTIETSEGAIAATRVVVCAGAWTRRFLPTDMSARLSVTRQTLHWFDVGSPAPQFDPARCPVFIWNDIYGFPEATPGGGVKIATEDMSARFDPDSPERPVSLHDVAAIEARARAAFSGLGPVIRSQACLYTATPDGHFRFAAHRAMDRVTVASACSGHGFKHAAGVGEALAVRPEVLAPWSW